MITIDYHGHPKRSLPELFNLYRHERLLIMDDVLRDEQTYSMVYQDMLDFLKYGLEYKVIREWPIHFIFHADESRNVDDVHVMELRHFLSTLCLWYAFMKMENSDILNESFIPNWIGANAEDIATYIDEKILPYATDEDFASQNAIVDEIIFHIKAISDAFCLIFGYSASIWDIMKAEEADPEIHEILYQKIDPTLQPKEMEDLLGDLNKRLMAAFGRSDSDLRPLLLSGKNISANQFKEIFLRTGFKADLSSRTIPWFLDDNILLTGINMPSYFFIRAMSGRKAQMDSKLQMSKPGALSKKMNHSATASILRKDNEICDSARPVYYTIEDDLFLKMLDKRYYYDEQGNMKLLNYARDKQLIGKRIGFRSPCTCTSKEGVCRACYGELFDINKDLFSQGSLAATKESEPWGQSVLSQKHSQFTDSAELDFDDLFYQYFDIVGTEATLNDDLDLNSGLLIQLGPVTTEETDGGDVYRVDYFDIVDFNGELKAHVQEQHEFPLYLANEMVTAWKQAAGHPIPMSRFSEIEDSEPLFNIEVKSKAVTQGLQMMTAILDSKDHLGNARDLDGMCQTYAKIIMDAGITYPLVHGEMIIKSLLRKVGSELEDPDFSANGDHNDYEIMRLTWNLRKNQSPIIRLSTGWLKSSLVSPSLYKSTKPCHFDALFVPKLNDVI